VSEYRLVHIYKSSPHKYIIMGHPPVPFLTLVRRILLSLSPRVHHHNNAATTRTTQCWATYLLTCYLLTYYERAIIIESRVMRYTPVQHVCENKIILYIEKLKFEKVSKKESQKER